MQPEQPMPPAAIRDFTFAATTNLSEKSRDKIRTMQTEQHCNDERVWSGPHAQLCCRITGGRCRKFPASRYESSNTLTNAVE